MQTWRRCIATSASALGRPRAPQHRGIQTLRIAQIYEDARRADRSGTSQTGAAAAPSPQTAGSPNSLEDTEIKVQGFVRSVRKQKRIAFAEISDGSTVRSLQAVLTPDQAVDLTTGAAIEISGLWKACPPGKEQTHELQATAVKIVGPADAETYPIQKKYHTPDFLRQVPHLRLRTPYQSLLQRFRSECIFQLGNVFHARPEGPFTQVQPPLITSSDCEGAGEVFTVAPRDAGEDDDFFRAPKYLTVSSQLHLEAYAAELGGVWTLSPTFRAEKSDTPRHLSEFYMLEAEVNFMHDLESLTGLVESLIRDLTQRLYSTTVGQEILSAKRTGEPGQGDPSTSLEQRWLNLLETEKWPRITYGQAVERLEDAAASKAVEFDYPPSWSVGLQLEHEKFIVETVGKGAPVFVTDYPKAVKPFYMAATDPSAEASPRSTVACFDLLMPEISEVAGGSLREHRLSVLIQNMREHGLIGARRADAVSVTETTDDDVRAALEYPHLEAHEDLGPLWWYADLRRWGAAPHGGFGLGFDRFLGHLAGVGSIRDVVPFPRYFGRADC